MTDPRYEELSQVSIRMSELANAANEIDAAVERLDHVAAGGDDNLVAAAVTLRQVAETIYGEAADARRRHGQILDELGGIECRR